MSTYKFKTTINCNGCVARVTPLLDKKEGIENWEVDIANPDKILTVKSEVLSAEEVMKEVKKGGFTIEEIHPS